MPFGAVGWEGGQTLITAIDLIKEWRNKDTSHTWLDRLHGYTTDSGDPELIWHHGGPELLHDLVLNHDYTKAEQIIRSVIEPRSM
ncbi:hypothetical protein FRC10_002048 [Ceratobasidium sp. 414]|nr:hypothetical protein FRC10_002048 [Ceratobasidium sp. 414]